MNDCWNITKPSIRDNTTAYEQTIREYLNNPITPERFRSEYESNFNNTTPQYNSERYEYEIFKLKERLYELETEQNSQLTKRLAELTLRADHPAVQEAWEQYQIIIRLVQE